MAVRELNGTSDDIVMAPGGLSTMTYGTMALIVKRLSTANAHRIFAMFDTGNVRGCNLYYTQFGDMAWGEGFNGAVLGGVATSGVWRLIVARKATGAAIPRFSVYDYTSTTWTHANASGTINNAGAPGSTGSVVFTDLGTANWANVRVAVRGAWNNTLPWTADTTGDTAIQGAGLHTALSSWTTASPSALWTYDQASVATAIADLTGGGATQRSISGTTVVTGDDPPGFAFAAAAAATVSLAQIDRPMKRRLLR